MPEGVIAMLSNLLFLGDKGLLRCLPWLLSLVWVVRGRALHAGAPLHADRGIRACRGFRVRLRNKLSLSYLGRGEVISRRCPIGRSRFNLDFAGITDP